MQITILISILLIALVYLHITQNRLIFQWDVKVAGILTSIALVMLAISACVAPLFALAIASNARNGQLAADSAGFMVFGLLFASAIWVIVVAAYFKFFAGCRKAAFFKLVESADPLLRTKVRGILLDVIERKWWTEESGMFIQVNHQDPLVEDVRCECEKMHQYGIISEGHLETLKGLAEKLKD
ncbi:MAG: hypothetical protein FVQ82_10035 [Planctomycetes bacterium]|nr:hypothetical protein [Planctomycetota bacterium]